MEINDVNKTNILNKDKNYLLMFYTDWCPHCPLLCAALEELQKKEKEKFDFLKINFDENPGGVKHFDIVGVPAVLAIQGLIVTAKWIGVIDIQTYQEFVNLNFG